MQAIRKVVRWLWLPILFLAPIWAIPLLANDEAALMGRWRGEWYRYMSFTSIKVELEIVSASPFEGRLYETGATGASPASRSFLADVGMEVRNGKVFLNFTGPAEFQWKFELFLKGKTLEGEGEGWGKNRFGRSQRFPAHLKLEKMN
jgi:hypothetical protein